MSDYHEIRLREYEEKLEQQELQERQYERLNLNDESKLSSIISVVNEERKFRSDIQILPKLEKIELGEEILPDVKINSNFDKLEIRDKNHSG